MYRCEWNGCVLKFRSIVDLERHVKKHLDDSYNTLTPSAEIEGRDFTSNCNEKEPGNSEEQEVDDIFCCVCHLGKEQVGNVIVFCDGCDEPYHQACHSPPIGQATVDDSRAKWFCKDCTTTHNRRFRPVNRH